MGYEENDSKMEYKELNIEEIEESFDKNRVVLNNTAENIENEVIRKVEHPQPSLRSSRTRKLNMRLATKANEVTGNKNLIIYCGILYIFGSKMKNVQTDLNGLKGEVLEIGISMGARLNQIEQDNASEMLKPPEEKKFLKIEFDLILDTEKIAALDFLYFKDMYAAILIMFMLLLDHEVLDNCHLKNNRNIEKSQRKVNLMQLE
ncbi:hypothetical protein CHUAL_009547 [Chamberlinius hualienensis]